MKKQPKFKVGDLIVTDEKKSLWNTQKGGPSIGIVIDYKQAIYYDKRDYILKIKWITGKRNLSSYAYEDTVLLYNGGE